MNVAGALALDHGGIVIGDAQSDFGAELAAEIIDKGREAVGYAGGVFGGHDGVD
jgi:hypothetical protein